MVNDRNADEPPSLEGYLDWYNDEFDVALAGGQPEYWYKQVTDTGRLALQGSEFWKQLLDALQTWDSAFRAGHNGHELLAPEQPDEIGVKPFESAVNKSFRLNILKNEKWPAPPEPSPRTGPEPEEDNSTNVLRWYGPHNWLTEFSDIYRIRLVASYFDGVKHLAEKIKELAEQTTPYPPELRLIAEQDGYHAVHLLVRHDLIVDDFETREFIPVQVHLEIQITTDIQAKIITMLHKVYEQWRVQGTPSGWQWDHGSTAFAINYLGSTLHYLEGMMVIARDINGGTANDG